MCPTERRGASTEAEIRQQTVPSTFTAKTAFLVAAERTGGIEFVVSVGPHYSGAELINDFENLAPFVGPDTGAQSVRRVVGARDCFLGRAKGHDAQDRTKDFFLRDPMRGGDAGKKARRIPIAFSR